MRRSQVLALGLFVLLAACGGGGKKAAPPPSTTTRPVVTTTTAPTTKYTVKRGDTLSAIAHRVHVSSTDLQKINHIANPDVLHEGDTLLIPPAKPLKLVAVPAAGPQGQSFELRLTGAQPNETITFEVDSPKGKFTGPPHSTDDSGSVSASYQTAAGDATGTYAVVAHGDQGTNARTAFIVLASTQHT
jgi:LysM repeat protein